MAEDIETLKAKALTMLRGSEDQEGTIPAVTYADHSYPAFSQAQMVKFAVDFLFAHLQENPK